MQRDVYQKNTQTSNQKSYSHKYVQTSNFDCASTAYSQFGPLAGLSVQGGRASVDFDGASYFTAYSQFGPLVGLSVQGAQGKREF